MKGPSSSCSPQYVSQIAWCVDVLEQFIDEKSRGKVPSTSDEFSLSSSVAMFGDVCGLFPSSHGSC